MHHQYIQPIHHLQYIHYIHTIQYSYHEYLLMEQVTLHHPHMNYQQKE